MFLFILNEVSSQTKVLFIGNSLTAWHNQPAKFESLAVATGKDVYICNRARPGITLEEHSNSEITLENIKKEKWDYVILQDSRYEIAFPAYHSTLDPVIEDLSDLIYENCSTTKIIFFLDYSMKDGVTILNNYYSFNDFQDLLTDGTIEYVPQSMIIAPIGEAFRVAKNDNPGFDLIENDKIHPSNYGSYLSACVYYSTIFTESCLGNTFYDELTTEDAQYLQSVASSVVMNNPEKWHLNDTLTTNYISMEISYTKTDVSVFNGSDGSITVNVYGGIQPYEYKLNDGDFGESNSFSGLSADIYTITIKDNVDSIKVITVTIEQPDELTGTIGNIKKHEIDIYPNPVNDYLKIESNFSIEIESIEIFNLATGYKMYHLKPVKSELEIDLSDLKSGSYQVKVDIGEKVYLKKIIKL